MLSDSAIFAEQPLSRLLLIAADNAWTEALCRQLAGAARGADIELRQVARAEDFDAAVAVSPAPTFDAVLYAAADALLPLPTVARRMDAAGATAPLIVLTTTPADVAQTLQAGACAVIEARDGESLLPAIAHEIHAARQRAEHRAVLEQLRASEARFHGLASHLPGMLFHLRYDDATGYRFLYVSEGCQKLFGIAAQEALQAANRLFDAFDAEEKKSLQHALQDSAASGTLLNWEGRTRGRARYKWINLRSLPQRLADGAVEWHGIATNISNSKESEAQLKKSRQQLAELSNHLEVVKEEERERISRDIHDELGSLLVRIKIEVALLAGKLPETAAALRDKAASIESLLDQALATASRVARELRPGILKEFGLAAAIECQAEDFGQRTGIACHVQCDDEVPEPLPEPSPESSLALFRIAQEALTNIAKHAQASRVFLRLHRAAGHIVLEIRDNGRGVSEADMQKPKSFGLRGIRERVASLGGDLSIVAAEQGGTHLIARVPENADATPPTPQEAQRTLF